MYYLSFDPEELWSASNGKRRTSLSLLMNCQNRKNVPIDTPRSFVCTLSLDNRFCEFSIVVSTEFCVRFSTWKICQAFLSDTGVCEWGEHISLWEKYLWQIKWALISFLYESLQHTRFSSISKSGRHNFKICFPLPSIIFLVSLYWLTHDDLTSTLFPTGHIIPISPISFRTFVWFPR